MALLAIALVASACGRVGPPRRSRAAAPPPAAAAQDPALALPAQAPEPEKESPE
jgi:hypothetical protein